MKLFHFLLLIVLFPTLSYPCTCAYPTFEEQWKKASVVFQGKVLRIQPHTDGVLRVDLEVEKVWKGPALTKISVTTPDNSAACGYTFEIDAEYLVYADGTKSPDVGLCSRTRLKSAADEDLKQLEKEKASKSSPTSPRDPFSQMKGDRIEKSSTIPRALNITNAVITGITKKNDAYVALIRATNNKVYFLKVGDKLHDGVVLKIDNNSVTFRQYKGYRSVLVRKELRPFPDE